MTADGESRHSGKCITAFADDGRVYGHSMQAINFNESPRPALERQRHAGGAFVVVPGPDYDWGRSPRTLRLVRDVGPGTGLPGFFNNLIHEPSARVNSSSNGLLLDTFAVLIV